jgi:hypothetical protein
VHSISSDNPSGEIKSVCPWYALYTRHRHEKTVAHILTNKGFEILLPLYPDARRWKDRTKLISLPLFPCYVFLKGGLERRLDIVTTFNGRDRSHSAVCRKWRTS